MKDREKIIPLAIPRKDNRFYDLYLSSTEREARDFSNKFIMPRKRLTMPEIMNSPKPCDTCIKVPCMDCKEDIVMCVGDKETIGPWEYATNRIIEIKEHAVQMGKSLEIAAKNCKDAAENFKKAFANTHLGEPYQEKEVIDHAGKISTEWDTSPADPVGDFERAIGRRIPGPFKKIKRNDNAKKQ